MKVEIDILKNEISLHFIKSSVEERGRKPTGVKGTGAYLYFTCVCIFYIELHLYRRQNAPYAPHHLHLSVLGSMRTIDQNLIVLRTGYKRTSLSLTSVLTRYLERG